VPAGDVVFDHVWFRYDASGSAVGRAAGARPEDRAARGGPGVDWTLEDVSFVVPAGTTTALVGETGAGKTTLGYLAARLYEVERGSVTIGGVDVRDLTFRALSDLVGVVSQETYLFHASVRENLRFAKPDASDDEIESAAEAARIHHVIAALPDGYDTVVGERGITLSGGQRQRIAIARALLVDPRVLILDDATASVDATTEARIRAALREVMKGRTTLIIAHRLSTISLADEIAVIERGRIVARGTPDEVRRQSPVYREIEEHGLVTDAAPEPEDLSSEAEIPLRADDGPDLPAAAGARA
jgi:ATP-binding cassette, subfamily B, bacterial